MESIQDKRKQWVQKIIDGGYWGKLLMEAINECYDVKGRENILRMKKSMVSCNKERVFSIKFQRLSCFETLILFVGNPGKHFSV